MSGEYESRPIGLDALRDEETQTTAVSGGKKGVKLAQVGALDPVAIIEIARVAGYGANKYAAFNYLQGFEYSKAYNAMQRHLNLFWAGEDVDPESGRLHLGHAAIEAMFLISFYLRGIGTDDRPPRLLAPLVGTPEYPPRERCIDGENGSTCGLVREAGLHQPASQCIDDNCIANHRHHVFVRPTA